jgi:hypothetical protein
MAHREDADTPAEPRSRWPFLNRALAPSKAAVGPLADPPTVGPMVSEPSE